MPWVGFGQRWNWPNICFSAFQLTEITNYALVVIGDKPNTNAAFESLMGSMNPRISSDGGLGAFNMSGWVGQQTGFSYALFPVVYHIDQQSIATDITSGAGFRSGNVAQVNIVPFIVIASSQRYEGQYLGAPGAQYFERPINSGQSVHIDLNYIAKGDDALLSIQASAKSLLTRWGAPACYLTIMSFVNSTSFNRHHEMCQEITRTQMTQGGLRLQGH